LAVFYFYNIKGFFSGGEILKEFRRHLKYVFISLILIIAVFHCHPEALALPTGRQG